MELSEQIIRINDYLENCYIGAKTIGNEEDKLRIARAILPLKADPYEEIFTEYFQEKVVISE